MSNLSLIKTVKDIIENVDLIIKSAEISLIFDPVLKISLNEDVNNTDVIMMGSGIIRNFLKLLNLEQQNNYHKGCGKYLKLAPDIEFDDIDFYLLKPVNLLDICDNVKNIIHTKKSINNLVIDRYLPCDRIASNVKKDVFYISLQCLYSLLTGNCYIPQYLQNIDDFILVIHGNKYINEKTKNNSISVFDNFNSFIKIYEKYGYNFSYVEVKTILPGILSNIKY